MNSDFEKKLAEQSLRELPPEWRKDILGAAKNANAPVVKDSYLTTVRDQIVSLLWPNPRAWAALAAVWVAVLVLNSSTNDDQPSMIAKSSPAPDWIAALREQQRLLTELSFTADRAEIQRPKKVIPSPRSQLRKEEELFFV